MITVTNSTKWKMADFYGHHITDFADDISTDKNCLLTF